MRRRWDEEAQSPAHELIERRDRVAYAVGLIRDLELPMWFEQDWAAAGAIAMQCPACTVFSIPPEALLIDDLDRMPEWRRTSLDRREV
jgi:hypothetical protein